MPVLPLLRTMCEPEVAGPNQVDHSVGADRTHVGRGRLIGVGTQGLEPRTSTMSR